MTKNVELRLTQTLTFITNNRVPGIDDDDHNMIVAELTRWNGRATAEVTRHRLSRLMSQESAINRPRSKVNRDYRRAAMMVRCALAEGEAGWAGVQDVVNKTLSNQDAIYHTNMKAARVALYRLSRFTNPKKDELMGHPEQFLRKYRLKVRSAPAAQIYPFRFYMTDDGAFELAPGTPTAVPGSAVNVFNIPVTQFTPVNGNLGALQATRSDAAAGFDLIVTPELSACCFVFQTQGGVLAAVHLQPPGPEGPAVVGAAGDNTNGARIATRLRTDGAFANGPGGPVTAFGIRPMGGWSSDAPANSSRFGYRESSRNTVIAIRQGGDWQVFAQMSQSGQPLTVMRLDNR